MATQSGDLMTIAQVAELVGLRKAAFYNGDAGTREIPFIRLGGSIRYRRRDVEEWLERNTVRITNVRQFSKKRA